MHAAAVSLLGLEGSLHVDRGSVPNAGICELEAWSAGHTVAITSSHVQNALRRH